MTFQQNSSAPKGTAFYFSILNGRLVRNAFVSIVLLLVLSSSFIPLFSAPVVAARSPQVSAADDQFLDDIERRAFSYFWREAGPETGLVLDRARTDGVANDERHRNIASIAATGFGLTSICIGDSRGWVTHDEARKRVVTTLKFFAVRAYENHGWFYHWLDANTGERAWNSEVSSIDTALLLGGVLTVRGYYQTDREIVGLADKIYNRIDFDWMRNGDPNFLSHGWKPETGFIKFRWNTFSEDTILYVLAIGSSKHAIPVRSWYALHRDRYNYDGFTYFTTIGVPLFMHQFSHAWIDYRNKSEIQGDRINYFENSSVATRAHRAFCIGLAPQFPGYSSDIWGITASDSAKGYLAWGGPPMDSNIDGTVVPSAAGGSLMFTPDISIPALRAMKERYGSRIYGKFGFADAFNPETKWVDPDVIGIDLGITLLSAENLRSANVWRWFMRDASVDTAMRLIGFQDVNPNRVKYKSTSGQSRNLRAGQ